MADLIIDLTSLDGKKSEFVALKAEAENIYNEFNSCYLSNISDGELSKIKNNVKPTVERIKKSFTNCNTWFSNLISDFTSLESNLAGFSGSSLTSPTEFGGEFIDMFGKRTMPVIKTGGDTSINAKLFGGLDLELGDGTVDATALGSDYTVVNTEGELFDFYQNVIRGKDLYQSANKKLYADQCLGFAYNYAWGLYKNDRSISGSTCRNNTSYGNNFKRYTTNDQSEYLSKVYNEIKDGKPVVLQVIGSRSNKSRHYVTAVGFKKSVTDASKLKTTDLLIVDTYDGEMESVVPMSAKSGRYVAKGTEINSRRYKYGYELYYIDQEK